MRVHCYGKDRPWFLLELDDVRILLDAALDVHRLECTSVGGFDNNDSTGGVPPYDNESAIATVKGDIAIPQNKIDAALDTRIAFAIDQLTSVQFPLPDLPSDLDLSAVDVWLLSNYWQIAALPYLTERHGFRGRILATEPTVIFARLYMDELRQQFGPVNARQLLGESASTSTSAYRPIYTEDDIERSLDRIQEIRFHEHVMLVSNVLVVAYSSGYCLGSANWRISRESFCVAYVSSSSMAAGLHPMAFESSVLSAPLSVALVADVRRDPAMPVSSMLERFQDHASLVIRRGGNLLLPMYPHGVHYDLLIMLTNLLERSNLFTPIFVVSGIGDRSRQYSDILGEWMQSPYRDRMYVPENPLIDETLVKSGRVSYHKGFDANFMQRYREPCIVFTGDPSLRAGPVVHMISMWGRDAKNAILFTDPRINVADAVAPFGSLTAEIITCPIDLRLTPEECRQSLSGHLPDKATYLVPEHIYSYTREVPGPHTRIYKSSDIVHLDYGAEGDAVSGDPNSRQAWLSESVARQLWLRPIGPNVEAAHCGATLSWRHGELFIEPLTDSEQQQLAQLDSQNNSNNVDTSSDSTGRSLYGNLSVDILRQRMEQLRMQQITVEQDGTSNADMIIHAQWNNAHIRLIIGHQQSQVITDNETAIQIMTNLLSELLMEL
ncbi:beta-lactamase-like protein [Syncephalis fuscata]|nr:beta-lactamase-like protein [Syncephalis fuscata]